MIKAGALPYAILISFLITLLCSILIGVHLFYSGLFIKEEINVKLKDNIESGLNIILSDRNLLDYNTQKTIFLFDRDSINYVTISKKPWGVFDILYLESSIGEIKHKRSALAGSVYNNETIPALYLSNQNNYLYISGDTKISGDCYVPGGFIKTGTVDGIQYKGSSISAGKTFHSLNSLPEINSQIITGINNYIQNISISDSILDYDKISVTSNEISRSFTKKTILLHSESSIILNKCKFNGNVIIRSNKSIEIDSGAKLKDILLFAPYIHIKSFFKGNIQAYAKDSLVIEKECMIDYPSFVGVTNGNVPLLNIKGNTKIGGGLILYHDNISNRKRPVVIIDKDCLIRGIVYSNSIIELYGKVLGSVYAQGFMVKRKSSEYTNYIYDAEINARDLSKFYVGPSIFSDITQNKLIEWLE